jgi:AcrR family transcriptional regulator
MMSKVNREEIARAALEMLDEEGLDALSMRRLADRLGVGTMTLYGYVRSKQELLDAAVGAAVEDFDFELPEGGLRERMRAHVHGVRELFELHPSLPALRARQPIVQPAAFRMTEQAIQILLDAGFPPEEAPRAFRVIFVYEFGSLVFGGTEPSPEQRRTVRAALQLLPEDEFSAVSRVAEHLPGTVGGREQFDYGLELILDALEARAARYSAASSHQ